MKLYQGNILTTPALGELTAIERGIIAVDEEGVIAGVYETIPQQYRDFEITDFGDQLIIPGFCDLHLHSSQAPIQGLGHDEDGTWFTKYCYPIEKKYDDLPYAHKINRDLIENLYKHGILHANIMTTTNYASLMDLFEQYVNSGLCATIGKMNSDYPAFGTANEDTKTSIKETREFIKETKGKSPRVKPCLAPEFVPALSSEVMSFLGEFAKEEQLKVHSHMCEGDFDNEMVAKRFRKEKLYGRVYERFGLFGDTPTVMAHCITITPEEIDLMAKKGVFLAHCANSILNSPSDRELLAIRRFIDAGVPVGLASDSGGSFTLSMLETMRSAIFISKQVKGYKAFSAIEVFYLATKSGGAFFEKTGAIEPGYFFDALIVDDKRLCRFEEVSYTLQERLTRFVYCGEAQDITHRYVHGQKLCLKSEFPV